MTDYPGLAAEHPTLCAHAEAGIEELRTWQGQIQAAPGGSAWHHHTQFAQRTEALSGHLKATLLLSNANQHPSALAIVRTALEHHILNRLILLADRYIEVVQPEDPARVAEWEADFEAKTEPWTRNVDSIERIRNGRALRLIRYGHPVTDDDGNEVERISPYWVALDHYDPMAGHPDEQEAILAPFRQIDERVTWARRNQGLYGAFLRWKSMCNNLRMSELVTDQDLVALAVHYRFLSTFTHAVADTSRGVFAPGPAATHLYSELALLYVNVIVATEIEVWETYIAARPTKLAPITPPVSDLARSLRHVTGYLWFLGGRPQLFDRVQQANAAADPLLREGKRPERRPDSFSDDELTYYRDPLDRLRQLHTGGSEMMTGFGFGPLWPTLRW